MSNNRMSKGFSMPLQSTGWYMGIPTREKSQEEIVQEAIQVDQFSKHKWRILTHPDRAAETLNQYAELEVNIVLARNLPPRESWTTAGQVPDAAVEVWVNDVRFDDFRTHVVRNAKCPVWNIKGKIPIITPNTMLRFQVIDDQVVKTTDQGFVEVCVGDIPFDSEISGSFELRLQDNLKRTSLIRYRNHRELREDEVGNFKPEDLETLSQKRSGANLPLEKDDIKARRASAQRAMLKARTIFHACGHGCAEKASSAWGTSRSSNSDNQLKASQIDVERTNAGELYMTMKLVRVVDRLSAVCANALDAPAPQDYGLPDLTTEADEEEQHKTTKSDKVRLQQVLDVYTEAKMIIMFDFVWCLFYYTMYIITWRRFFLSLVLMICMMVICAMPQTFLWSMLPMMLAIMLIANASQHVRKEMTRGGANADITDEGFKQTAKWQSTTEMYKFVERIVMDDLQATITNPAKLRVLSSHIFRSGEPKMSLTDLRNLLRREHECIAFDIDQIHGFKRGDLILVDERHLATVTSMYAGTTDKVAVEYMKERSDGGPRRYYDTVDALRVRKRQTMPSMAEFMLRGPIDTAIRHHYPDLVAAKEALIPIIKKVTDIVTWRKYCIALSITLFLFFVSIFFVCVAIVEYGWAVAWYVQWTSEPGSNATRVDASNATQVDASEASAEATIGQVAKWVHVPHNAKATQLCLKGLFLFQKYLDNGVAVVVIFFVFVLSARWFVFFKSIARIIGRSLTPRTAPRCWAFFREDEEVKKKIVSGGLPAPQTPLARMQTGLEDMRQKVQSDMEASSAMLQGQFQDLQNKLPPMPKNPFDGRSAASTEVNGSGAAGSSGSQSTQALLKS